MSINIGSCLAYKIGTNCPGIFNWYEQQSDRKERHGDLFIFCDLL